MHDGNGSGRAMSSRVRRRDRHGRGLRGSLVPPDVPLHRTRSERFDDLVLLAVSQLEPRWEAELSGVEFGVEEIPPVIPDGDDPEPIPLARLDPGSLQPGSRRPGPGQAGPLDAGDLAPRRDRWPTIWLTWPTWPTYRACPAGPPGSCSTADP